MNQLSDYLICYQTSIVNQLTRFVLHNLFHFITSRLFCSHLPFHTSSCQHRHQIVIFPRSWMNVNKTGAALIIHFVKTSLLCIELLKTSNNETVTQWICMVIFCASQETAHFWFFLMCFLTWDPDVVGHVTSLFSIFVGLSFGALHALWIVNRPICTLISWELL